MINMQMSPLRQPADPSTWQGTMAGREYRQSCMIMNFIPADYTLIKHADPSPLLPCKPYLTRFRMTGVAAPLIILWHLLVILNRR